MTVLFVIGLISLAAFLTSIFAAIEQRLRGNDSACATAILWMMCTFVVFSICLITYTIINNQ
ncbi:MAG: hypothetical protein UH850_00120 [Paludibacteraceae bacterium]|nr:hypothetical protein [Paludibacteraceae bacterium]